MRSLLVIGLGLGLGLGLGSAARADAAPASPTSQVDIDEHLGRPLPTDLVFRATDGKEVKLGHYFKDGKPVVLVLAYFRCPMLCDLILRGLADGLKAIGWTLGKEYRALTVSIDPKDTPETALRKQTRLLQAVGEVKGAEAWPFLTGTEPAIHALADAVGFRYAYDPRSDQFAHPAVAIVLTPDGRVSRYLYGVRFPTRDLRFALVEASHGTIGGIVDRVLLTCFHYDPSTRRYGLYVSGIMRGGAALVLLMLTGLLYWLWRLERRRREAE